MDIYTFVVRQTQNARATLDTLTTFSFSDALDDAIDRFVELTRLQQCIAGVLFIPLFIFFYVPIIFLYYFYRFLIVLYHFTDQVFFVIYGISWSYFLLNIILDFVYSIFYAPPIEVTTSHSSQPSHIEYEAQSGGQEDIKPEEFSELDFEAQALPSFLKNAYVDEKFSQFSSSLQFSTIENISICALRIHRDNSYTNIGLTLYEFMRKYYSIEEAFSIVLNLISDDGEGIEYDFYADDDDITLFESQAAIFEQFRSVLDNWKNTREGELRKKLNRVSLGILSAGILPSMGLSFANEGLNQYITQSQRAFSFTSMEDLAYNICDLALDFVSAGYECFTEKSLQPLLCRDRHCRNWINEYYQISEQLERAPANDKFDPAVMLSQIDNLLGRGAALMTKQNPMMQIYWKQLSSKRETHLSQYSISNVRKPPFAALIYGPPGIGKTTIINILADFYHKVVTSEGIYPDLPFDPRKNMYTRNPDDDFFSGYQGAPHWCMVLDDLAKEHIDIVKTGKVTSIKDIITIVNSVGVCTNQAELSKKGTVPILPKLVLGTTNTKMLNAHKAVAEPAAIHRRLPYCITPHLKEEYKDEETGIMKKLDHVVHDAWTFDFEIYKMCCPSDGGHIRGNYEMIKEGATFAELQQLLYPYIVKHEKSSDLMMEVSNSNNNTLCMHKCLEKFCSICNDSSKLSLVAQSGLSKKIKQFMPDSVKQALFPPDLKWQERLTAYCIYNAFRIVPYNYYGTIYRFINVDSKAMRAAAIKKYRDNIPSSINKAQIAFFAIATATLFMLLKTILSKWDVSSESQSGENDAFEDKFEKFNRKRNENFSMPHKSKLGNKEELLNSVHGALVRLTVGEFSVSALSIGNNSFVTVNHIFPDAESWDARISFGKRVGNALPTYKFILEKQHLNRLENDLCVFRTSVVIPRKNIYDFLPPTIDTAGRDCVSYNVFQHDEEEIGKIKTIRMTIAQYRDDYDRMVHGTFMAGMRLDRKSAKGDCGSLVISESNGRYYISGMHCAGEKDEKGTLFKRETGWRILISQLSQQNVKPIPHSAPTFSAGSTELYSAGSRSSGPLLPPSEKKGIHLYSQTHSTVLGSYPGRISPTTKVSKTIISDDIQQIFDINIDLVPPIMKSFQNGEGEWINPMTVAANSQGNITHLLKEKDVEFVTDCFIEELLSDSSWLKDVGASSLEAAVNGVPQDPWINRLAMSTSGGFYFPGPKRRYFDQIDEETYFPRDEVLDMILKIESSYAKGERANIIFNATLKDEPIKSSKAALGKTRVFTACDAAFSIVVRQQFLKITKAIMKNNFITECAVGINAYSTQWCKLYEFLTEFGEDKIIAGDYSNYDKNMPALVIHQAFRVLNTLRDVDGSLSDRDRKIGFGIATDISYPITNFNGDLFQFNGGNPSGHPLTVIINSIVNSIYVRYAFMKSGHDVKNFKKHVNLMTYGDDNIMGCNLPTFNHTVIQDVLGESGIPYTMADKDAASEEFISIHNSEFLKRKFVMNEYRIVAPLSLKSTLKSLCYYVRNDNISNYQHIAECYASARREWSLHGKEIFDLYTYRVELVLNKPEYSRVRDFFIDQHYYDYETTLLKVLDLEDLSEQ